MAAISRGGLNTLYALQQRAGLQPGSLSHVIQRLEAHQLQARSESGKRRRRIMSLTEAGEVFLEVEWRNCLDPRREMESILRSATVALLMGDPGAGSEFLFRSAVERDRHPVSQDAGLFSPESTVMDFHEAMRAVYGSRRRVMEAQFLHHLAKTLLEVFKNE